jgi:hypothetical protein
MKNILILLVMVMTLSGCATTVAESGRRVQVVSSQKSELLKNCQRLGQVTGEAGSFLNNGEHGVIYATNDARNKAGLIAGADTLEVISDGPRAIGGTVTGIVYNCTGPVVSTSMSPTVPAKVIAPANASAPPKSAVAVPVAGIPAGTFEKARKCQDKGGVWVNDICVVSIE